MIRRNTGRPANPKKFFLALGLLGAYIKRPLWFVLCTAATIPKFMKQVPEGMPCEFIKSTALQTWMYMRLKKAAGQEKAFEVMRAFLVPAGLAVQQANFRTVEHGRTFENLVKFQQQTNAEGPTRWNEMEVIEQSPARYEFRVYKCMFYELYSRLGIPEFTKIMCAVDNAIFNTYLPDTCVFHRNGADNRIADGAKACHFVIERY